MTATIILWTFVFFAPEIAAGREVHNLTEQACKQLLVDVQRSFGGHYSGLAKVGQCYPQGAAK